MKTNSISTLVKLGASGAVASLALACGGATSTEDASSASAQPDFRSGFSAEGLTLESSSPSAAAGRFARRDGALRFSLTENGAVRHLEVTTESGAPVVDSTLEDGIDTSVFFGGKARAHGPIDGEPTVEGDPAIWSELDASPEARLLPELKEALSAAHVDEALFRPVPRAAAAGGVTPKSWYDGYWHHLGYDESYGFWSWTFWGTTTVILANEQNPGGGFYSAAFNVGASAEYVSGWTLTYYRRQWWGAYVTVRNNWLPLSGQYTVIIAHNY